MKRRGLMRKRDDRKSACHYPSISQDKSYMPPLGLFFIFYFFGESSLAKTSKPKGKRKKKETPNTLSTLIAPSPKSPPQPSNHSPFPKPTSPKTHLPSIRNPNPLMATISNSIELIKPAPHRTAKLETARIANSQP